MVENLTESPGMCSDGPGSAPIEIPKREAFSLRGGKKERKEMTSCGLGRRKEATGLSLVSWDPPARDTHGPSATPPRTVREVRGRSGAPARTVRYSLHYIQSCPSPSRAARTVRVALEDGPPRADGQSGPPPRIVRPSFSFSA
jgi:hypothetical protein